ncbi:MAG: hypothetical protein KatS3mg068_0376 [Candidatus Sericytochromatia bacterium]|nr:MAG: hypothetical protein KatS3mg068_0376 [Candidatus Sericytochromatia bacterium]
MRTLIFIIIFIIFTSKSYSQETKNLPPNPINILEKNNNFNNSSWVKPAEGKIPNPFGNNYNFYGYYRAGHTGIDIENKIGTEIYSVDDGIVKLVKSKPNMRYGYYVVIEHKKDLYTLYGHLSKFFVKEGDKVKKGQKIALMGESGLASFPHLHFEVLNKFPINDGAWGYNFICKKRTDNEIKIFKNKKDIPESDFLSEDEINDKYGFLNKNEKKISYIYRMIKNRCLPKKIIEITYYNPELFLPSYEKSKLKSFTYKSKINTLPINRVKKNAENKENNRTEKDKNNIIP